MNCRRRYDVRFFARDRKSTRLNSSHSQISYAVFCLKKKNKVYLGRRTLCVTAENESSAEVPLPVRVTPEPRLILDDRVLDTSLLHKSEGLFKLPLSL